jgi:hypothetical protein
MRRSKKAQTEIIGIAIIVLLLVIGLFFMIGQRLKPKDSQKGSFVDPKLAQSFLNSLMKTKTAQNVIVSDIIKDCFSNRKDLCGSSKNCCEYAEETMKNALEATLLKQERSYRLTVEKKGADKLIADIATEGCGDFSEKEQPGFYYIPPPPPIIVRLDICKN